MAERRMSQMAVGASGEHFGAPGTPESLAAIVSGMSVIDAVQAAARLSVTLEQSDRGSTLESQRDLIREIFPPDTAAAFEADLAAGHEAGRYDALFFPGQLMALERLALAMGVEGPGTSFQDGERVQDFVLAAAQVNDARDLLGASDPDKWDLVDMAMYAMRAAEINKTASAVSVGGRAYRLWLTPTSDWPSGLETVDEYCLRNFGISAGLFSAIAMAPALMLLDIKLSGANPVFNTTSYFSETTVDPELAVAVLDQLTFQPTRSDISGQEPTYWCFYDFAETPLLPCGPDLLVPACLRFAIERATTGIFWMLHRDAGDHTGALTTHFGRMFESYCVEVTRPLSSPDLVVSGEVEYGRKAARRKSSDVMIAVNHETRKARVFVECRAGRPPRAVFEVGDRTSFIAYVEDLKGKLRQLDRSITDHRSGMFAIEGDEVPASAPYLPLLVLDEPFQWSIALRALLDECIETEQLFRTDQVLLPMVCGLTEYEYMISVAERGVLPVETALAELAFGAGDESLSALVYRLTGPLFPPSYTRDGFEEYVRATRSHLFR
ncbi:MAG TPA: hypothetical protein VHC63_01170 [Acidimicrobiales bacterium]|nr:hypothetical protein [Acidimicrobiales bacterium]